MKVDFDKNNGLVPAIIQDAKTDRVLMLGYMNAEALKQTRESGFVTFYSRSKNRLWTKGETSGNHLTVSEISPDCDHDTILIKAIPSGPVCHTGKDTCFDEKNTPDRPGFLDQLQRVIADRRLNPKKSSYTSGLFEEGLKRISQKVGEECVEMILDAGDPSNERFKEEAADLIFHLLVLLEAKGLGWEDIVEVLRRRAP